MPTRLYFTEHTTSEQLRITWETRWHSLSIWLGDNRVQEELSFQQLKRGVSLSQDLRKLSKIDRNVRCGLG